MSDQFDWPTVCATHGRFVPCRYAGSLAVPCDYTSDPGTVALVRKYQDGSLDVLEWDAIREGK